MRNHIKTMFSVKGGDKGFTLIELLVVIAIIGILAATVVLSLGSRTGDAGESRVKLGVSSMRTLAYAEVIQEGSSLSGQNLCNNIYEDLSGDRANWQWTKVRQCNEGHLIAAAGLTKAASRGSSADAVVGELCCHAKGEEWVVWGALSDADGSGSGKTVKDIYCADSNNFVGELDLSTPTTNLNTATGKAECKP